MMHTGDNPIPTSHSGFTINLGDVDRMMRVLHETYGHEYEFIEMNGGFYVSPVSRSTGHE